MWTEPYLEECYQKIAVWLRVGVLTMFVLMVGLLLLAAAKAWRDWRNP